MSKKSKAAAAAAEQAKADAMVSQQQQTVVTTVRRPTVSFKVMNNCNPVPVARPADFIQLTPIVQPIPIVPYSSQLQPLAQFDEDEE